MKPIELVKQFIDSSTKEALVAHHGQWRKIAFSCDSLDVMRLHEGDELTYLLAGLPLPERLIWVESPFAGAVAASILQKKHESVYLKVWHKPLEEMTRRLWDLAKAEGSSSTWLEIEHYMRRNALGVEQSLVRPIRAQIREQLELRFGNQENFRIREGGLDEPISSRIVAQARQTFSEETWAYVFARLEQQFTNDEF